MVTWELFESDDAQGWDRRLADCASVNVFQSYGWGEFRRVCGWRPMRWIARDKDATTVGMAQVLAKVIFPGVLIGWVPGGPVCPIPNDVGLVPGDLMPALLKVIKSHCRRFCVRFDSYAPPSSALADLFRQTLVRPLFRLNTGYSLHLDLDASLNELRARMTAKHRYYVKKGLSEPLEWKAGTDEASILALLRLHEEMVRRKGLNALRVNPKEISSLCRTLGPGVLIFTGYQGGEPVTSCLVLLFGGTAFYWMAATSLEGRKISASYAMIYRLLEYLQARGVRQFDFGGLDPGSSMVEGVNHFKRGFGGTLIECIGEWESASNWWWRWGVNLAVRLR